MTFSRWSQAEVDDLVRVYSAKTNAQLGLAALCARLGRRKSSVSRKAAEMGLSNIRRQKVAEPKHYVRMFDTVEKLRAAQPAAAKARIAKQGHPRGALGLRHSADTLAKISAKVIAAWKRPDYGNNTPEGRQRRSDLSHAMAIARSAGAGYSRCHKGERADLGGVRFRSSWEANYARHLRSLKERGEITSWVYEPRVFVFAHVRRGTRSYRPDFRVVFPSGLVERHEVKGWMDPASRRRLDAMALYFPEEVVRIVGEEWFRAARKNGIAASTPGWER